MNSLDDYIIIKLALAHEWAVCGRLPGSSTQTHHGKLSQYNTLLYLMVHLNCAINIWLFFIEEKKIASIAVTISGEVPIKDRAQIPIWQLKRLACTPWSWRKRIRWDPWEMHRFNYVTYLSFRSTSKKKLCISVNMFSYVDMYIYDRNKWQSATNMCVCLCLIYIYLL